MANLNVKQPYSNYCLLRCVELVLMVITLVFGEAPFFSFSQCKLDFHSKQRMENVKSYV